MARLAFTPALVRLPLVLDMVDVDSAKWAALARTSSFPRSWIYAREARLLARFEADATRRAYATLVTTDRERETLHSLAPGARIEVVQNGVDADGLRPAEPPSSAPIAIFSGVLNYEPNVTAARWLVRDVWPRVRAARPDARLHIVGARPIRAVRALASAATGIDVLADVPDMRPHLWSAAVAVAPLRTARGVQNKVLEAVAAGLPAVITPVVETGVPAEILPACIVAAAAPAFADAIVGVLNEPAAARRARVRAIDLAPLTWPRRLDVVSQLVARAAQKSV
jgi:glycosyltransferase involved in cell wall biosynthesis